ncbi:MAG: hypothetical protein A2W35_06510 [Chloroflexi bacterium RBG_16_57_11]|nr:MAG: hypothetical protein A2W35_06510 [Chloroflexi bacterium RBG_16_57_11]
MTPQETAKTLHSCCWALCGLAGATFLGVSALEVHRTGQALQRLPERVDAAIHREVATARVDVLEWADTSLLPLVDGHATGIRRDLVGQVEGFRVDLRQDVNVLDARAGQAIALANFQVSGLRADLRTQINAQANKLNDHIGEVEIRLRPLLGNANESLIRFPGLIEETSRSLAEVREATVRLERETTALVRNVRASSINFREATIRAKARPPWWLRWLPGK